MNIENLSNCLGLSGNESEVMRLVKTMNEDHNLGIETEGEFTALQYDILLALLSPPYLISRIKLLNGPTNPASPDEFNDWCSKRCLDGCSTEEIERVAPGGPYTGLKRVAGLMRANGYKSRVAYLGKGRQGRRWFKPVSFI